MKIELAGYNLDMNIIEELKKRAKWNKDNITPETISAAYARISRNPADIPEIRENAIEEIEKSRKSNQQIIFGLGHSSVAEHAVFNIDLMDISRLAVEDIQKHRLASFTEKSQRYIKIENGYYIPDNFDNALKETYKKTNNSLFYYYQEIYEKIKNYLKNKYSQNWESLPNKRDVLNKAKEDARYVLPLSTYSQMGMTINARSLEYIIKKLKSSRLQENRNIGTEIFQKINYYTPSIIKYTNPENYDIKRIDEINKWISQKINKENFSTELHCNLLNNDAEEWIIAGLIYEKTLNDFTNCLQLAKSMTFEEKKEIFNILLRYKKDYHKPDRIFELPDFIFDLTVSASCYAQLKRHRMTTQISSNYNIQLGFTTPPLIVEAGLEKIYLKAIEESETLWEQVDKINHEYASYCLTNAHRRKILLKTNARELYHLISLRADKHSQWDIRNVALQIKNHLKEKHPILFSLLKGKDEEENEL